jgi:hypothetical protein
MFEETIKYLITVIRKNSSNKYSENTMYNMKPLPTATPKYGGLLVGSAESSY